MHKAYKGLPARLDPPVQLVRRELLQQSPVRKVLKAIKETLVRKVYKG